MAGYTYATFVTALSTELVVDSTEPNFVAILPTIIDQAEQRCYRELDLLATIVRDTSATTTANSRNFTLPSAGGRFVTVQGINIFTPAGTTTTRNQLVPTSRDVLDNIWPSETAASAATVPTLWAPITDQTVIFGPPPGAAFTVEVIGTIRPTPLSSTNTTTWLSLYLPDMFFDAAMVAGCAYQKNFGAQSDNPQMALSWEALYQTAKASANVEELRRKFQSVSWSAEQPSTLANPPRT